MNPLSLLSSIPNTLIASLASALIAFSGGIYLGHNYTQNHYEAQINAEKVATQKAIIDSQAKADLAIGQLFKEIQSEQAKSAGYQSQARQLYANTGLTGNSVCRVSFGFIRLFNDSATSSDSAPQSTDILTSPVDLATVLATSIDNHRKYQELRAQIEAIRIANE